MRTRMSRWGEGGEETIVLDQYDHTDEGAHGSLEWRRYILDEDGKNISYWHDLPLVAGQDTVHAFIEIPKNTRAKYEMCPTEPTNPIKQVKEELAAINEETLTLTLTLSRTKRGANRATTTLILGGTMGHCRRRGSSRITRGRGLKVTVAMTILLTSLTSPASACPLAQLSNVSPQLRWP